MDATSAHPLYKSVVERSDIICYSRFCLLTFEKPEVYVVIPFRHDPTLGSGTGLIFLKTSMAWPR